jgi:hypothetical protein
MIDIFQILVIIILSINSESSNRINYTNHQPSNIHRQNPLISPVLAIYRFDISPKLTFFIYFGVLSDYFFYLCQRKSSTKDMDKNFIGRKEELQMLKDIKSSGKAEFVAVYGRRRVGKTYLIQQFFNNDFAFSATGIIEGNKAEELFAFTTSLISIGYQGPQPKTWLEAFECLKNVLASHPSKGRCVIYIDELPCFDTPKSGFIHALGYFWNTLAALNKNIILIVCGSATSWMIENIVNDHG